MAQQKKPALVFSGNAGENYAVDLEKYNRIHFGETGMTLVNSENPDDRTEVLYAAYHRFKVAEAEITADVSEKLIETSALVYNPQQQSLSLTGEEGETYTVGVFDVNGTLMLSSHLLGNSFISVESLRSGVYVAVAVGNKSNKSLKFVKK